MSATDCDNNGQAPVLKWTPKIYVGDARTQTYVRKAADGSVEQISCSDKDFDSRIVLSNQEILKSRQAYNEVIKKCLAWQAE